METVRIYRLTGLRPRSRARLRAAQMEAAQVWMLCRDLHLTARQSHTHWPTQNDFHQATKGLARIESFTGPERGTSSRCPVCGWKQKVKGRNWHCRNPQCGFQGHRDVVGSVNMHLLAFGSKVPFPAQVTYRRPGPVRVHARNEQPGMVGAASRSVVVARTRATRRV